MEKFIGDAVMAVWGTPVATEDDAERAVRAALDLVAAVSALGDEIGAESLRARAGVLTGEAAVTIGAEGEGMVAGDLVNTASRIQSVAPPGSVYVGDATRRATEQTIAYEDAGSHELQGKEGLFPLFRALRVVSGARGSLKAEGLEAPFVGRDRELRLVKELFHGAADDRTAHLVSIIGFAGIGKSRLAWEFFKYIDGLPRVTYWHRGRCLSYGEGVTYWALADMVQDALPDRRGRSHGLGTREAPRGARRARSRRGGAALRGAPRCASARPRGTEDATSATTCSQHGGSSSSGWPRSNRWRWCSRTCSGRTTRCSTSSTTCSSGRGTYPIFVCTLARPEIHERRPTWGVGQRSFTSLYLEPLAQPAMEQLLDGLVPGLPEELRAQILERAEGVPLYAVETVRMMLDRGALVQDGPVYRPAGPIAVARGAGDAARADRSAARRAGTGRAPRAPGRRRPREDASPARRSRRSPASTTRARAALARAVAQGDPFRPGRPALA